MLDIVFKLSTPIFLITFRFLYISGKDIDLRQSSIKNWIELTVKK